MSIDEKLYTMPIIGPAYERMHSYFRKHITVTDLFHVFMGLGIGLMFANRDYTFLGVLVLLLGLVYHVYAYIRG